MECVASPSDAVVWVELVDSWSPLQDAIVRRRLNFIGYFEIDEDHVS